MLASWCAAIGQPGRPVRHEGQSHPRPDAPTGEREEILLKFLPVFYRNLNSLVGEDNGPPCFGRVSSRCGKRWLDTKPLLILLCQIGENHRVSGLIRNTALREGCRSTRSPPMNTTIRHATSTPMMP